MSLIKVRFLSDYITCSVSFSDNFKIHVEIGWQVVSSRVVKLVKFKGC